MLIEKDMARKNRRGFTLTEAAIVLGIVGLILGAIWVAAASVYDNLRISTTSNQLLQIVQSIRSMHATQLTVDSNISAILVAQAGGVPSDMIVKETDGTVTAVRDVWGGDVSIEAVNYNGVLDAFSITFTRVPQSACTNLLVRNTGDGHDTGLVSAGSDSAETTTFPIPIGTAVGFCSDTTTTGNSVKYVFRLKA